MLVIIWQVNFNLISGGLSFLQTQNIWIVRVDKLREFTFIDDRTNAVYIPREKLHNFIIP